jgi:hypothetical protein
MAAARNVTPTNMLIKLPMVEKLASAKKPAGASSGFVLTQDM